LIINSNSGFLKFQKSRNLQFWFWEIFRITEPPVPAFKILPEPKEPLAPGIDSFHERTGIKLAV
jgi:hypothetical protein